jgi:hypothetical protein
MMADHRAATAGLSSLSRISTSGLAVATASDTAAEPANGSCRTARSAGIDRRMIGTSLRLLPW